MLKIVTFIAFICVSAVAREEKIPFATRLSTNKISLFCTREVGNQLLPAMFTLKERIGSAQENDYIVELSGNRTRLYWVQSAEFRQSDSFEGFIDGKRDPQIVMYLQECNLGNQPLDVLTRANSGSSVFGSSNFECGIGASKGFRSDWLEVTNFDRKIISSNGGLRSSERHFRDSVLEENGWTAVRAGNPGRRGTYKDTAIQSLENVSCNLRTFHGE